MKTINFKGKGEHSVNELELIIEQQAEELHLIKSGQKQLILSGVSQQREQLEAYQHFIDWNEEHDRKASTSERIESFIASNCG